jgi:hypothetical protein
VWEGGYADDVCAVVDVLWYMYVGCGRCAVVYVMTVREYDLCTVIYYIYCGMYCGVYCGIYCGMYCGVCYGI